MFALTVIVSVIVAGLFIQAGVANLRRTEMVTAAMERLGVSAGLQRVVGGLEVAGAVGLVGGIWFQPVGILAAGGLVLIMVGAVIAHVREGAPLAATMPAYTYGAASVAALGLQIWTV